MAPTPLSPLMVFAFMLTFFSTFSETISTPGVILTPNPAPSTTPLLLFDSSDALVSDVVAGPATLLDADSSALAPDVAEGPVDDLGFTHLDTSRPSVIALAKFAVDEFNKKHKSNLVFSTVIEAIAFTHARGANYELVVAATSNDDMHDYTARLWFDGDEKRLVLFQENE